jgi:hypothetical protein
MTPPNLWQCIVPAQDFALWSAAQSGLNIAWWKAKDGATYRGYSAHPPPQVTFPWIELVGVVELAGASLGQDAPYHYVVETDVEVEHLDELNAWYEQEHLPGLAAVPGTVRARRYRRTMGTPRQIACYDLVTPEAMERAEWLAVRHTEWSSRVRPMFRNTYRTLYTRVPPDALQA